MVCCSSISACMYSEFRPGFLSQATYDSELAEAVLILRAEGPLCERNMTGRGEPLCGVCWLPNVVAGGRGGRRDFIRLRATCSRDSIILC